MPDNSTTGTPQDEMSNGGTPQDAMSTTQTDERSESTTQTPSADDLAKEIEQLRTALKKANNDAKAHRLKADELDKLKAETEASKLSETEKLQKQVQALQTEKQQAIQSAQEVRTNAAIQVEAMQQGLDPKLASKLIERSELELDEQGNPTNVSELLKSLIKQYPNLAGKQQAPTSGGATNPARSSTSGATQINEQFVRDVLSGKLPHDTYSKLAPEQRIQFLNVQQSMSRR